MKNLRSGDMRVYETTIAVYQWPDIEPFQSVDRHTVVERSSVAGVRVEMTRETWDEIMEVYQAHKHQLETPAVRDAYQQYLVVRALADQNRPVWLPK